MLRTLAAGGRISNYAGLLELCMTGASQSPVGPADEQPPQCERRRLYYQGRVQGVGFRQTAWHLARGFEVVGYVKNLPDGRVELLAEGRPAELDRFLAAVGEKLDRYIRHSDCRTSAADGTFRDFTIEH